jgi:hypothetical protein
MADNYVRLPQEASFPKPILKLYLYKVARNSGLWKFNHDFTNMTNGPTGAASPFVGTGGDPADIDVPSSTISAKLGSINFGRLPFDSWIPRKLSISIDPITGLPNNAGILTDAKIQDYYKMEDIDRNNILLNWKNIYGTDFTSNFTTFFANRKAELIKQLKDIVTLFQTNKRDAMNRYDLTSFVIKYSHDTVTTDTANILDMELASDPNAFFASGTSVHLATAADIGSFQGSANGQGVVGNVTDVTIPLIEENDIIELRVKYLNSDNSKWEVQESGFIDADGYQRVFMGYVTSQVRTTQYNNQERVNVVASGASKIFSLYDTSFVPSIQTSAAGATGSSNFEAGIEMSDNRFSIWANRFNGMSVDNIFDNFMRTGLFCQKLGEIQGFLPDLISQREEKQAQLLAISDGSKGTDPQYNPQTAVGRNKIEQDTTQLTKDIAQLDGVISGVQQDNLKQVFKAKVFPNLPAGAVIPPNDLDIEYYMPMSQQLPSSLSFQIINYIPVLMSLARAYAMEDATLPADGDPNDYLQSLDTAYNTNPRTQLLSNVMATVEQAGYLGYKTMMQSAFKMFFPDLKRPSEIFSDLKANTYLEMFEDRPGVIRLRPPKYNIINLNPEVTEYIHDADTPTVDIGLPRSIPIAPDMREISLNAEYVIPASAIQSLSVHRDDVAIATRSDHTFELPYQGQPLEGYTGHFTDAGYLLKYGLRTTGPQRNPMSMSPQIAAALSAVHMAVLNAQTRTIQLTLFNTREYRLGRLYYIPISHPSTDEFNRNIVSRGIVGYVSKITTALSYAQEASHVVTLESVRQAEVIALLPQGAKKPVYYANFKKLPDIATYMRLLATDKDFSTDAAKAINQLGSKMRDALNSNTTASYEGAMVIPNGMDKLALNPAVPSAFYGTQLNASGIKSVNIPSDSSLEQEKNNFATTIAAAAVQDGSDVSISKNLLAKVTTYDSDPLLKLYPKIQTFKAIPQTESVQNRDVTDLLCVVFGMLNAAVDHAFQPNTTFNLLSIPSINAIRDTGQIKYIRIPATPGSDTSVPGIAGAKRTIWVGTQSTGSLFPSQVVFGFVQTEGPVKMNKFFVFHVPYTKSARLANMINMGTPPGCGYRRISTVKTLGSNPQAKSDLHNEGSALVFSNLDVATWSFSDIVDSCVELDFGPSEEIPSASVDLNESASDMYHLINSYANVTLEPFNFVRGNNPSYNPVAIKELALNAAMANDIVTMCLRAVPTSVLGINFPVKTVTEPDHTSKTYLKKWFADFVAIRSEHVLVPIQKDYFVDLFTNITKERQDGIPSLYTSVMNKLSATPDAKNNSSLVISPSGSYLVNNKLAFNDQGRPAFAVSFTDINKFSFKIDSSAFQLLPKGKYIALQNFVNGSDDKYSMLCMQLVDNYALISPATTSVQDTYRIRVQGNALSALWHLSYAKIPGSFQSEKAVAMRQPVDQYQKLNLKGLVN